MNAETSGLVSSQPAVIKTSVKTGQATVNLTSEDLFDRVINLRFIHKPVGGKPPRTWTIRSDYEVLYFPPNGMQYIPVLQKPSIKVEMKYVSNKVAINVVIEVDSLFIKNPVDLEIGGTEPLAQVEIQMGYLTQMPDWATDPWYSAHGTLEQFMALYAGEPPVTEPGYVPPTKIIAQVLYSEKVSGPPNQVTRFTCVIGSMEQALVWRFDADKLMQNIAQQRSTHWLNNDTYNLLPQAFFLFISRRFIRTRVRHDIATKETRFPTGNNFVQTVTVATQSVTIFNDDLSVAYTLTEGDGLEDGRLSTQMADSYGVIVYMSDVLWKTPLEELPQWGLDDTQKAQAVPIKNIVPTVQYETLEAQLNALCNEYPFLRFYTLGDGNVFAYHVLEKQEDLFASTFVKENQSNAKRGQSIVKLPAVYDITWGGTRQIRMPFIGGITPMMTVAFPARYALNDLVGAYYKPKPGHIFFLVLLMDITYGTVKPGDNMMLLTTTDIQGPDTPTTNPDGSVLPVAVTPMPAPPKRTKTWSTRNFTVVDDFTGLLNTTDTSWATIIDHMLATATGWGTPPTAAQVLTDLQSWNSGLFDSGRVASYPSPESVKYGVSLSRLFAKWNPVNPGNPDVIVVKLPYKPTYPADEEMQ